MTFDPHAVTAKDLRVIAKERGKVGKVAVADQDGPGLAPWQNGATRGPVGSARVNEHLIRKENTRIPGMIRSLEDRLPPIIRRTPRERFLSLSRTLLAEGMRTHRVLGYPVWPRSVQDELRAMGWKEGNPDLAGQVEALARRYIERGSRRQQE